MQVNNRITSALIERPDEAIETSRDVVLPAFAVCPMGVAPWQQRIYQAAFEQAAANLRTAVLERICKVVWN